MERSRNDTAATHKIIIVEDDEDDRLIIEELLGQFNCHANVKLLADGEEVLDYLNSLPHGTRMPSLIVLDNNMPRLGGEATLNLLKNHERFRSIPVAIYSNLLTPEKERAFIYSGACSTRQKPEHMEGLRQLLREYCEFARL
jgi:CheY-like chemotaxis protein